MGQKTENKSLDQIHESNVRRAIQSQRGVVQKVAEEIGCSRKTMRIWLDNHPYYKTMAQEEREGVKDLLESTAWKLALGVPHPENENEWIVKPNDKLLWNLLKSFAQDRGYYDGPQFGQGNPEQKIVINLTGKFVEGEAGEASQAVEVEHEPVQEVEAE